MKRILLLALTFIMVLALAIPAHGEDALYVNLEAGDIRDGRMYVMINTNARHLPDKANTTVTLDGEKLDILDVNKFSTSGMKTSYMLLVDISGSVTQEGLQSEKAVASGILNILSGFDNMAVMQLGETIITSDFTSDRKLLEAQIDALKIHPRENTSVFGGIYEALDILNTSKDVHERRCLIVVTDGCDTVEGSYTYDDTLKKITSEHIPLHVAALVFDRPRAEAKKLEALALASPGGTSTLIGVNNTYGKDAARAVAEVNSRAYVLTCSLDNIKAGSESSELKVSMSMSGEKASQDEINVDTLAAIAALQPPPTPTPTVAPTPAALPSESASATEAAPTEPTPPADAEEADALSGTWFPPSGAKLYIELAALVLIIAVVVLLICLNRAKRRTGDVRRSTLDPNMPRGGAPRGRTLRLTRLGMRERDEIDLPFTARIVVGSDPKLSQLVFPEDVRLSPAHCAFEPVNGGVVVRDLNSGTMTFVNGVPIREPKLLSMGDEVIFGAYRFKVEWTK